MTRRTVCFKLACAVSLTASLSCSSSTEPNVEQVEVVVRVEWPQPELLTQTRSSVTSAIVELRRSGTVVASSTQAVTPTLEQVPLTVLVPGDIAGTHELSVRMMAGATLLYRQLQNLELPLAPGVSAVLTMAYAGPGADGVQAEVVPATVRLPALGSTTFEATVRNASSVAVPTPVHWIVEDPSMGTITQAGVFTAAAIGGVVAVRAVPATGQYGEATIEIRELVDELQLVTPAAQSTVAGTAFAQAFRVRALRDGEPVAGADVAWDRQGAELSTSNPVPTDTDGYSEITVVAGTSTGGGTLTATVDGVTAVFSFEIQAGPAVHLEELLYATEPRHAALRTNARPPRIRVQDALGNGIEGVPVHFTVTSGGGSLAGASPVHTGLDGSATAPAWTMGGVYGDQSITATTPCTPEGGCLELLIAKAVGLNSSTLRHFVSGDAQVGPLASPLAAPIRFSVGEAVSGVPMSIAVMSGNGELDVTETVTDAAGEVAAVLTPRSAGPIQVAFTILDEFLGNPSLWATATGTPVGFSHSWLGLTSEWSDAGNWSAGTVPTIADSVLIPGSTPFAPTLSSDAVVASLAHFDARPIALSGHVLSVHGNLNSTSSITGDGRVDVVGEADRALAGTFDVLRIVTPRHLSGLLAARRLVVESGAVLELRSSHVIVSDSALVRGFIRMTTPLANFSTLHARFDSDLMPEDMLTDGRLIVTGDLLVPGSLRTYGAHRVYLLSREDMPGAVRRLNVADPTGTATRLAYLQIMHFMTLETGLHVAGDADLGGEITIAVGAHLNVTGALRIYGPSFINVAGTVSYGTCTAGTGSLLTGFTCVSP